jgi:hypothetical protein
VSSPELTKRCAYEVAREATDPERLADMTTGQPLRLRAGTKVHRTLYRVHDDGTEDLIGMVDTADLAAHIVAAVNAYDLPTFSSDDVM